MEETNLKISRTDAENGKGYLYTITNGLGLQVKILSYGATIISILAPNRMGECEEVTLSYRTQEELEKNPGPYYGCIAGRYANRIKEGKFLLDGNEYKLAINNGPNALHGGINGFDKKVWDSRAFIDGTGAGVVFTCTSSDGEEGYPGNLNVTITYTLSSTANDLDMKYVATTDKATPINLTNHTYFNLSGECRGKIYDHNLYLNCSHYLPVTEFQIPTGEIRSVNDSPNFDFTSFNSQEGRLLNRQALEAIDGGGRPGLDHCFIVNESNGDFEYINAKIDGNQQGLRRVAILSHQSSGRELILHSTFPGVQVYSANWLALEDDKEHFPHTQHNGICLETQHFPDSPNQQHFPSTILRPGETYQQRSLFSFRIK